MRAAGIDRRFIEPGMLLRGPWLSHLQDDVSTTARRGSPRPGDYPAPARQWRLDRGRRPRARDSVAVQRFEVREVLKPAEGPLVGLEIFEVDEGHLDSINRDRVPPGPACLEVDACQGGEEVDPCGRQPELDDEAGLREVRLAEAERAEAEGLERVDDALWVLAIGCDPDVEILRIARMTVSGQRIAADDEEPCVTPGE